MTDPGRTLGSQRPPGDAASASSISAVLRRDTDGRLSGWAFDASDLHRRLVIEIMGDGVTLALVTADMHVGELVSQGHGDGCYGFAIRPDPRFPIDRFELLLANDDRVLARCSGAAPAGAVSTVFGGGTVVWRGGLRLGGTIRGHRDGTVQPVQIYDGSRRLDVTLTLHADDDAHRFDLFLPAALADGDLHDLRVLSAAGVPLDGSPVSILAGRGGFRGLSDAPGRPGEGTDTEARLRLEFLDLLLPASLPFESYPAWRREFTDEGAFDGIVSALTLGVVILGRDGSEATLSSLRQQRGASPIRAVIIDAEDACFSPADWRAARSDLLTTQLAATLVIRAGAVLAPFACLALASAFARADGSGERISLCVADHEIRRPDGTSVPFFGPAFDYERLLSQGYAEGVFAVRELPEFADEPAEAMSGYDVLFAALEAARAEAGGIVQIPQSLAAVPSLAGERASDNLAAAVRRHMTRSGHPAVVETRQGALFPLVYVRRPRPEGEVAIIIPTRDRLDLLKPCLASIRDRTIHPDYRIVIVDNGSGEQETLDYLGDLSRQGVTVLRDDRAFNYARLNNLAMREIGSPFACLLNNDVEVLAQDWLAEMQSFFARDSVGGVGAKLVWPNGMLQHGGVVLGMNFAAGHAYDRYLADELGYADGILGARECSALTAACLLVRREDFLRVGGFDEVAFPVAFNDVDLCLKLREAGKTLVWTPQAQLLHRESASRASDREMPAKRARFEKELAELRRRWGGRLVADAYYSPNLNLDAYSFTGLAAPPRDRSLRGRPIRF